jgi:hypothetical protein
VPDDQAKPELGVEDVAGFLREYDIPVRTMPADTSTAVSAAAGSNAAIFEIGPDELSRIARAEVGDFAD